MSASSSAARFCAALSQSINSSNHSVQVLHIPGGGKKGPAVHGWRLRIRNAVETANAAVVTTTARDPFVATLLDKLARHAADESSALQGLAQASAQRASTLSWPTRKDEAYRFTDVKPLRDLLEASLPVESEQATTSASIDAIKSVVDGFTLQTDVDGSKTIRLVLVDGVLQTDVSDVDGLPSGLVVGSLRGLSQEAVAQFVEPNLGRIAYSEDLLSSLNGAAASDVIVIAASPGVRLFNRPIHVLHLSSAPTSAPSFPRLLVVAQAGAEVEVVEEYADVAGAEGVAGSVVNSVAEIMVAAGAEVKHSVVQDVGKSSVCIKHTHVAQASRSRYSLVEAQLGSQLARHNLTIRQLGPDTSTEMSTFALSGHKQLQDLHSCLVLDHPRGEAKQLHKCIVTDATGHCVFDGNVKVNKFAQQTNAGQLTRSLLLAPRGTVNVKPNLQIIADDVKCTHGAAISDLDDDQLFYFRSRGVDERLARSALVYSFGAEVLERLPYEKLRQRVEAGVKRALSTASNIQ